MFERLKFLYDNGLVQETNLNVAVIKAWITKEEKQLIMT